MKKDSEILEKIGRRSGMTVPEDYFTDFAARMTASLPPLQFTPAAPAPRSFWSKARPYIYMAAMFAGIWCMMKMLSLFQSTPVDLSIDNYPGVVTALSDESFVKDYVYHDLDQYDMLDSLYESGIDADDIFMTADDTYYYYEDEALDFDDAAYFEAFDEEVESAPLHAASDPNTP